VSCGVASILVLALTSTIDAEDTKRPSFLFLLVDDLGYHDITCYGSTFHETPNIDRLAASGMKFTAGYAAHPVCSPTRAAIMTGKNPARVRITDWIPGDGSKTHKLLGPADRHALPLEEVTIAERLKAAGYKTFFAGKWHLGSTGFFPEDQGFDINKGGHHRGSPPGGYYSPYKNPKLEDGPKGEYLTDRLTDETIRFIEKNRAEPFLAFLSFYTVHTPIQPAKRHIDHYKKKAADLPKANVPAQVPEHDGWTKTRQDNPGYASMVHAMDENVGRLLAKLDALDLAKSTVVIFTSDNGGRSTLHRKGGPTSNVPLRAGKGWCYEGGIRVPLVVRAPGVTRATSTCATPVYSADLYPTMLALAGLDLAPTQHRDGVDLSALLRGGTKLDRESIVWHYPHYHGSAWTPGSAIRSGRWKLVELYDKEKIELYDLIADESETKNLAQQQPERAKALRKTMHAYLKSVDAQMPTKNPKPSKRPKRRAKK
jgi:arylsulfatase A-like enzyme